MKHMHCLDLLRLFVSIAYAHFTIQIFVSNCLRILLQYSAKMICSCFSYCLGGLVRTFFQVCDCLFLASTCTCKCISVLYDTPVNISTVSWTVCFNKKLVSRDRNNMYMYIHILLHHNSDTVLGFVCTHVHVHVSVSFLFGQRSKRPKLVHGILVMQLT